LWLVVVVVVDAMLKSVHKCAVIHPFIHSFHSLPNLFFADMMSVVAGAAVRLNQVSQFESQTRRSARHS
jgi:hypothetical protein